MPKNGKTMQIPHIKDWNYQKIVEKSEKKKNKKQITSLEKRKNKFFKSKHI